jgi:hypothetical protein
MSADSRLTDRLISYWNTIRKENVMPDFSQFNASAIDDLWQQCVLFTVAPAIENKSPTLNFYQIGEKLRDIYQSGMVGKSFSPGQRHFHGAPVLRRVEDVIVTQSAISDTGQFVNDKSKVVKYRTCLLPFGRNGHVTHMIAGLSWREF